MKNISWCPCLKVRVNFLPRRNYAAHFTVCPGVRQWSAKYAFSMKADQIPKI